MNFTKSILRFGGWLSAAGMALAVFLAATCYYGSIRAVGAVLRGEALLVEFPTDLGVLSPQTTQKTLIKVTNLTRQEIELLGGQFDCSCIVAEGLPCRLAPGQSHMVSIAIQITGRGRQEHKAKLIAAGPRSSEYYGTVSYTVVGG